MAINGLILLNQPEIRLYVSSSINLDRNGRLFGTKSIGKWLIQSDFELIQQDSENITLCVYITDVIFS